jgi:cation/acetate symporter
MPSFLQAIGEATLGSVLGLLLLWSSVLLAGLAVLHYLFPPIYRQSGDAERPPPRPTLIATPEPHRKSRLRQLRARMAGQLQNARALRQAAQPARAQRQLAEHSHWQASRRLILPLLCCWFAAAYLPALFAPLLNQFTVLTGFPLDYYMGAQGSLIVFVAIIFFYAWRMARLDQRYSQPSADEDLDDLRRRLLRNYGLFTLGFILFFLVMNQLELAQILSPNMIGWSFLLLTILLYVIIGLRSRASTTDDYYVVSRRVPGFLNGIATGSDWMSAASFISMAGTLWLLGYEGLAYIMGWTGGYVLLALLLVPYLRKFGQYTIPDFVGARYEGHVVRIVAAVTGILISFTYLTAQVTGVGIIMSFFLGVNYMIGVIVGLSAVLFCSFLGGMKAVTWTQVAQGIVLVIAYLVPVTMIALKFTDVALPQLMYGEALARVAELEQQAGITQSYLEPFNDWTRWNFLALMLCLMCGTAGMPHILIRFYTVPSVRETRSSVGWALIWICMLYFTAPAYAAFARWEILQNVVGQDITALPEWTSGWARTGLLQISDHNADGVLQFNELEISPDLVVLAMPQIAGLPQTVTALVAAGGLAAALSTADGLLMVIASAVAHDIYYKSLNPRSSSQSRIFLGRLMVLAAALLAALTALRRLGIIVQLVAWAFSLAAASFFPILVLGIFWRRTNGVGAVAGMLSGLAVTTGYMVLNYLYPEFSILGITHVAAGVFGMPVNFLVTWLVSRSTAPPSAEAQALVDRLREP